jgi:hypothetical protein
MWSIFRGFEDYGILLILIGGFAAQKDRRLVFKRLSFCELCEIMDKGLNHKK